MSSAHITNYFNHRITGKHTYICIQIQTDTSDQMPVRQHPLVTWSWSTSVHPDLAKGPSRPAERTPGLSASSNRGRGRKITWNLALRGWLLWNEIETLTGLGKIGTHTDFCFFLIFLPLWFYFGKKKLLWIPLLIGCSSQEQQVLKCSLVSWMHNQYTGHCPRLGLKTESWICRKHLGIWWERTRCADRYGHSAVCQHWS